MAPSALRRKPKPFLTVFKALRGLLLVLTYHSSSPTRNEVLVSFVSCLAPTHSQSACPGSWGHSGGHGGHRGSPTPALLGLTAQWGTQTHSQTVMTQSGSFKGGCT